MIQPGERKACGGVGGGGGVDVSDFHKKPLGSECQWLEAKMDQGAARVELDV